jgi:hypothetical protein
MMMMMSDLNNKLEKSILARYKKHCSFIKDFSQKAMSFIAVFREGTIK